MIAIEGGAGRQRAHADAQEDTVLSPRFYTTDFDGDGPDRRRRRARRMGRPDRGAARDPNKGHFARNEEFDRSTSTTCPKICARSSSTSSSAR